MDPARPGWAGYVRTAVGILLCLGAGLAPLRTAALPRATVIRPEARPFSETWDQMVARCRQRQADIEAGRIPRPPRLIAGPDERVEREPKPVAVQRFDNLGAAFRYQREPTARRGPLAYGFEKENALSFPGVSMTEEFGHFSQGAFPPDTTGAIGPTEYIELVNGEFSRYDRQGNQISWVDPDSFFNVTVGAYTYPRNGAFDPRLFYDRQSGRWFACMLERGNQWTTGQYDQNNIILAVSRTSDPSLTWDKYVVPVAMGAVADIHFFNDYQTMGCDSNGVYFGWRTFVSSGGSETFIAATRKSSLLAASPYIGNVYVSGPYTDFAGTPHPALNLDPVGASDAAWWFGSNGLVKQGIVARYCTWDANGAASFSDALLVPTPAYAAPPNVVPQGSTMALDTGDNRLMAAVRRNGRVWMTRTVGVNSVGSSDSPDRCAAEYLVVNLNNGISLEQSARVYDDSATDPVSYLYPSIVPTGQGHAVMGCSDSQGSRWVGALGSRRMKWDALGSLRSPFSLQVGLDTYTRLDGDNRNRWGDYSYTTLDPNDDMTAWTAQEYADTPSDRWGTVISAIRSLAPQIAAIPLEVTRGAGGKVMLVQGSYLFDPGPGFPNHVSATIGSGLLNGVSVTNTHYVDPTLLEVSFDVAASASLGPRTLRVTNPDGQWNAQASALTVMASTGITNPNAGGQRGQTVSHSATLLDTTANTPVEGKVLHLNVDGTDVGDATTDASGIAKWTYKIPDNLSDAPKTTVSFAGEGYYLPCSKDGKFTVNKNTTSLYLGAVPTVAAGAYAKLYCYLKRLIDGKVLAGRAVSFTYNGITAGGGVTDANGYAEFTYLVPANTPVGSVPVAVSFSGDATAIACSKGGTATVNSPTPTSLYSNSAAGGIGATVTLYAYLWRTSDHAMLIGKPVEVRIDGVLVGTPKTDSTGYAAVYWKIPVGAAAGIHSVQCRFAGDADYSAVSRITNLVVSSLYSVAISTGSPSGARGLPVKLYAYLWRKLDGAMLSGKTLSFSLGTTTIGTAVTNASGYAYVIYNVPSIMAAGTYPFTVSYGGDLVNEASTVSGKLSVADKDSLSWYVANVTGYRAGNVKLYCYVKSQVTGLMLSGKSIRISVDGKPVGDATTTAEGYAGVACHIAEDMPVGAHTITAQFAGDAGVNPGSGSATLTVK